MGDSKYQPVLLPGMPEPEPTMTVGWRESGPAEDIVSFYSGLRGPLVFKCDRKVALSHASMMLKSYTSDEIRGCIKWLNEHHEYARFNWSLVFVARMMPQYRRDNQTRMFHGVMIGGE